jgi:hypothetical protein
VRSADRVLVETFVGDPVVDARVACTWEWTVSEGALALDLHVRLAVQRGSQMTTGISRLVLR